MTRSGGTPNRSIGKVHLPSSKAQIDRLGKRSLIQWNTALSKSLSPKSAPFKYGIRTTLELPQHSSVITSAITLECCGNSSVVLIPYLNGALLGDKLLLSAVFHWIRLLFPNLSIWALDDRK